MASTSNLGLRYPLITDDLNLGAINIQQLAEDTEAEIMQLAGTTASALSAAESELHGRINVNEGADAARHAELLDATAAAWAASSVTTSPVQDLDNEEPEAATFGSLTTTGQISTSDNRIYTYAGPPRLFLVSAVVKIANTSGADGTQWNSKASLVVNNAIAMSSEHQYSAEPGSGNTFGAAHTHSLVWLAYLASGDTVAIELTGSLRGSGARATNKGISFASIGRA